MAPYMLVIAALLGTIPVALVSWHYRNERVIPVGKRAFWSMGLGLLGIAAFYAEVVVHASNPNLVNYSRILWFFVILTTVGMSIGVLLYRRNTRKGSQRGEG